jgi:PAS domain S-box-containing protein
MPTVDSLNVTLTKHCPWGIAVVELSTKRVVAANDSMQSVYACREGVLFTDIFSLPNLQPLELVLDSLQAGVPWRGQVFPHGNRYGIGSVEVLFERVTDASDCVYVYTMEHPMVEDEVRFSSRSEYKMLRVLLDNTLEYIFFRDLEGHFILCNESFRSAVTVDGRVPGVDFKIEDFVVEKSAEWFKSLDTRMLATGQPIVNEVSLFGFQNGTKHWLQLTTVPVRNEEGTMIGSLSVSRDISDLKHTESELRAAIIKAQEASRAKGNFLAAMSHEIRTPINGIIGASELCQDTPLDSEQRGYLDTVIQCGSTLLGLVNDVLDFSKIEAGQLNLESLNFSPRSIIESVSAEFAQAARAKSIELILGFDADLPEYLMGDPTRVKQVFYNLVGNAIKFTDSGEVVIRADVIEKTENFACVRFSVSDTGIGISKERQEAIFKSFTQADMSTTRKYGGSGLGLSICKELVRLMDGRISVKSDLGAGACFEFELPFSITRHPGAEAVPFNAELAGLRVLIVDDNTTNCELYQQMCAGWGYRSTIAKDGMAGLSELEESVRDGDPYRLILLDQQMPGLTGLDLASLVRLRPDMRAIHIILLSSSLSREEADRAKEVGLARALAKPVKRATLQEVILETFNIRGKKSTSTQQLLSQETLQPRALKVLLVEDNSVNQDLAIRRLEKLGHTVSLASDGYMAVDRVKKERFDCILMDIQMPGMDGYEATKVIRAYEKGAGVSPVYIVAMTAHAMQGDREHCLDVGMDDYVSKPFRFEELKVVLRRAEQLRAVKSRSSVTAGRLDSTRFIERLQRMNTEDREDLLSAVPLFLESYPDDVLKLKDAVRRGDFKKANFVAHSIKGMSGIFSSQRCMQLAEQAETAANAKDQGALEQSAEALSDALMTLAKELELALA